MNIIASDVTGHRAPYSRNKQRFCYSHSKVVWGMNLLLSHHGHSLLKMVLRNLLRLIDTYLHLV